MMEGLPCPRDDVQVRQGRLDHNQVGSLLDVRFHLPQGLPHVCRIHLIPAAIPELGRGFGRLPEGAIEGRGVLGGVCHDRHQGMSAFVKGASYCCDLPVHHRRRRHYVRSGLRVGQGDPRQYLKGRVVIHAVIHYQAAVAVVRVFAEAHVRDNQEVGRGLLDDSNGLLDYALGVIGFGPLRVFVHRDAEEQHSRNTQLGYLRNLVQKPVQRQLVDVRHRLHRPGYIAAVGYEEGINQVPYGQGSLLHHKSQRAGLSKPP